MDRQASKHPTLGNGKICYLQIPALDIERSVDFYLKVFGWNIRHPDNADFFLKSYGVYETESDPIQSPDLACPLF